MKPINKYYNATLLLIIFVMLVVNIVLVYGHNRTEELHGEIINAYENIIQILNSQIEDLENDVLEYEMNEASKETSVDVVKYFDVPLDPTIQDVIFTLCEKNSLDPSIVVAMIEKESTYNPEAVGDGGNSLGLMQIQPKWHKSRMDRLGCDDLLNPYQNVTVGIDLLADLTSKGKPIEWVLMAYNGGESYANRKFNDGIISTYATVVLENSQKLGDKMIKIG